MRDAEAGTGYPTGADSWSEVTRLAGLAPTATSEELAAALQHPVGGADAEAALAGALRLLIQDPPYGRETAVSAVIGTVGARGLTPLLRRFSSEGQARRRFLQAAGRNLTPEAAARLVLAAAVAWDRPCSRPFMEVLAKLTRAATAGDAGAERAIRTLMQLVADRWGDITAEAASYTYEDMIGADERPVRHAQTTPEPERLVELAVELDALTGETWHAVGELVDRSRVPELLGILQRAPKDSQAARGIVQHVATPARLKAVLDEESIDYGAVDYLVPSLGISGAETLLDRLCEMQSREERGPLVERISALGPSVAPMVLARLDDVRWYVQANMLALLRTWKDSPSQVSLPKHAAHPDGRVRREALQLLLESDPERRVEAIVLGLRDHDPQNVHLALQAARGACPPQAATPLEALIAAPTTPPFLRVPAIRLLGEVGSGAALDVLLRLVDGGSSFMGKRKLAAKSPEMLAALGALRGYRGDRRAAELLAAADASRDDELRAAAAGRA